jgi:Zn-dependent protease/CBS domain-containing protein
MFGNAWTVGRIFGIEVRIDVTWIAIFLLITLSLGKQFELIHGDWGAAAHWSAALVASLLFFASILLHELGHSLTSIRFGVPVRSITLFLFGGVAALEREPERAGQAFTIAVAGPLVSLGLGVVFLSLAFLIPAEGPTGSVAGAVLLWLGSINLVLAVFNLLPGLPLDGGHMLQAALWAWHGDRERATRWAAHAGVLLAGLMIGLGLVLALGLGNLIGGLWLAFIGWFLASAARGSAEAAALQKLLGGRRVADVLDSDPPSIAPDTSVAEMAEAALLGRGGRWALVLEGGRMVGLVTLTDLARVPAVERESTAVRDVMQPAEKLVHLGGDASLMEALRGMQGAGVNQVPVLAADGRLLGALTRERLLALVRAQLELAGRAGN